MDIKLPVPNIDARQCLVSHTSHKLDHKNYFNSLLFHDHILKFHYFFSTSPKY